MSLEIAALMLDRLEAATGSKDKIATIKGSLAQDDRHVLHDILEYTLSSLITFGVKQLPEVFSVPASNQFGATTGWEVSKTLLDRLAKRQLTGGAAQAEISQVLSHLQPRYREVIRRILIKDLRCGVTAKTVNKAKPGTVFEWCVQLAPSQYADPYKLKYPVWVEIKHDGYRATKAHGCPRFDGLRSREGLLFENFEEVERHFDLNAPKGLTYDMEIMSPNGFSALKKRGGAEKGKNTNIPIYAVLFDVVSIDAWNSQGLTHSFTERRQSVEALVEEINGRAGHSTMLTLSEGKMVHSPEEVFAFYDYARSLGNEGIMVKDPNGTYEFTRSQVWQKMKPTLSADLKVVGFERGNQNGKNADTLGAYLAEGWYDGKFVTVGVGAGFKPDKLVRDDIWNHQDKYLGRIAEIEFMELSQDEEGNWSLRHPTHKRWRDDKSA